MLQCCAYVARAPPCRLCNKIQFEFALWNKNVEKKIEIKLCKISCSELSPFHSQKLAILQLINSTRRWRLCLLISWPGKSCNCQFTWPKSCGSNRSCCSIDFLLLLRTLSLSVSLLFSLCLSCSFPLSHFLSLSLLLSVPLCSPFSRIFPSSFAISMIIFCLFLSLSKFSAQFAQRGVQLVAATTVAAPTICLHLLT